MVDLLVLHLPPRLVSLSLENCELKSSDLEYFTWPSTLRKLDLQRNKLMDGSFGLPHRLTVLDLSANPVDDTKTEWIPQLPLSLEQISLRGSDMGDQVGMALHDWTKKAKLREVDVSETYVSEDVYAALRNTVECVG
ncbi:hypothetical protein GGF32_005181 [Allomyces javanicus]|nr:hypothetical protein GGF32_005181 [Allomyces javanicus]